MKDIEIEEKLSGVISNPPYIPSDDIPGLQAEVRTHEPRLALDGGLDGMDDLLYLCNRTASLLKPGGFFAFEVSISCFLEIKLNSILKSCVKTVNLFRIHVTFDSH